MERFLSRRAVLTVFVALLVVLAGCSGGGGGGSDPADAENGSTDADETTTAPDGGSDAGTADDMTTVGGEAGTSSGASGLDYRWTVGESYTYRSTSESSESTTNWTVTDISDGEVTVEVGYQSGENGQVGEISGPQGDIFAGDQSLLALNFVILQIPPQIVQGHSLSVGNSWTLSSNEVSLGSGQQQTATPQQLTVRVTGTSQVAGTQCRNIEVTAEDSTDRLNACVKEGWPFALSLESSGEETSNFDIVLTDYERP